MGEAAGRGADLAIVTSDNPRTEDPDAILTDITPGVAASGQAAIALAELATASRGHVRLVDRRAAIGAAIAAARPGDTVLIAGKGHEDYQIVGTTRHAFDDRVVAREAIAAAMPVAMRAAVAGGDA
jgi:UDP-N-acetylmuramoyl-L-alanyl-D-glutamate--2,6-diaminopimelate ligase